MPTSAYLFAGNEVSVRFQEQALTQAIDRKSALVVPRGVHKGFILGTSLTNLHVAVNGYADPTLGAGAPQEESAAVILVQSQTGATTAPSNDLALSLRTYNTAIDVDLSGFTSTQVVVGLYGYYVANSITGPSTYADIRVYTQAQYLALNKQDAQTFVPLGSVAVPASGAIGLSSITPLYRMEAWGNAGSGAVRWSKVTRNGGFEGSPTGDYIGGAIGKYEIPFWELARSSGSTISWSRQGALSLDTDTTQALVGATSLAVYSWTGNDFFFGTATQWVNVPVASRQQVRVRALQSLYVDATNGTSPNVWVQLNYYDVDNGVSASTHYAMASVGSPFTANLLDVVDAAPVFASGGGVLTSVQLLVNNYGVSSASSAVPIMAFDEVNVFVDAQSSYGGPAIDSQTGHQVWANPLVLDTSDPLTVPNGSIPTLRYDDTFDPYAIGEGQVVLDRIDQAVDIVPALHARGRLILGSGDLFGTYSILPRIVVRRPTSGPVLVTQSSNTIEATPPTAPVFREYVDATGAWVRTINAKGDATLANWTAELAAGAGSSKMRQDPTSGFTTLQTFIPGSVGATWADASGWLATYSASWIAAACSVSANGTGTLTLSNAFNISSITATSSLVTVHFTNTVLAGYEVFITPLTTIGQPNFVVCTLTQKTTSLFSFAVANGSSTLAATDVTSGGSSGHYFFDIRVTRQNA